MNVLEGLEHAGLSENEAVTYKELLRRDALPASELASHVGMDRSQMYTVLDRLSDKGLVQEIVEKNRKTFTASEPDNLLNPVWEKASFIQELIPELEELETADDMKNEITMLDGRHGLRTFVRQYISRETADFLGATGATYDYLYESPRMVEEMQDRDFTARAITNPDNRQHPMTSVEQLTFRYVDIDFTATTSILKDTVAFHYITEEPQIIILDNPILAGTYQRIFEFLWNVA